MFSIFEYPGAEGGDGPLRYGCLTDPARQKPAERALIFVPGLGGTVKSALSFLEELLPLYDPIYGLDLRGFGLNVTETPLRSFTPAMADLRAFLALPEIQAHESEGRKLSLYGISLGGTLATQLALEQPESFYSMVLLAPAFRPNPKTFSMFYTLKSLLGKALLGKRYKVKLPYSIDNLTRNPKFLEDPQYRKKGTMAPLTAEFMLSVKKLCAEMLQASRQLQVPTMMIIPEGDRICDPKAMAQAYQHLPATLVKACQVYPEFFHNVLMEEEYLKIAEDILAWERSRPVPGLVS